MDGPKQPVATQTPDQGEMRCQLFRPLGTPEGSVVIARSLSAGCLAGRPAAGGPEAGLPAVAIATALRSLTLPPTLSLRAAWPRPVRRPGGPLTAGRRAASGGGVHSTRVVARPQTPHLKKLKLNFSQAAEPTREVDGVLTGTKCKAPPLSACVEPGRGARVVQRRPRAPEPGPHRLHPGNRAGKPALSTEQRSVK